MNAEEFKEKKEDILNSFLKDFPQVLMVFFLFVISITLFSLYKWKILIVLIVVFGIYLLIWLLLIIAAIYAIKKGNKMIKEEDDDLDF